MNWQMANPIAAALHTLAGRAETVGKWTARVEKRKVGVSPTICHETLTAEREAAQAVIDYEKNGVKVFEDRFKVSEPKAGDAFIRIEYDTRPSPQMLQELRKSLSGNGISAKIGAAASEISR